MMRTLVEQQSKLNYGGGVKALMSGLTSKSFVLYQDGNQMVVDTL